MSLIFVQINSFQRIYQFHLQFVGFGLLFVRKLVCEPQTREKKSTLQMAHFSF